MWVLGGEDVVVVGGGGLGLLDDALGDGGALFLGVGVKVWKLIGMVELVFLLLEGLGEGFSLALELALELELGGTAKVLAGPLPRMALTVPSIVEKMIGVMTVVLGLGTAELVAGGELVLGGSL